MSNSGSHMTKGDAQLCQVARDVTQAYTLQRSDHQLLDVNRCVSQQLNIDRGAYQTFNMDKDTNETCEMARNVHQFDISRNGAPPFEMTRNHSQNFDSSRGIQPQFEMARSGVQHQYDLTRGVTFPFEPHRSGNAPYDMARGYEMGRGSHQYEMPRTQPYEMRLPHTQQVPQMYNNYDKGYQECSESQQDKGLVKEDLSQSLPDSQQNMDMLLEMPKTAPQPTVKTKLEQKTSGHPFDFAKGYAQQLEMAKKAAQNAIQAKIKSQKEQRARQEAKPVEKTKQEEKAEKPKGSAQPSEILKLYAQQLQMIKKTPKPYVAAKMSARQRDMASEEGSNGIKKCKNPYFHSERLERREPSALSCEDVRDEEENGSDDAAAMGDPDDDGHMEGDEGDPPPFEMAKYMAQLSKTKCTRRSCQDGHDRTAENTNDTLTTEEEMLHSPVIAANPSGLPFSIEVMKNIVLPFGAGVKAKRDRQELTIANKAKLIEQVESRGAKKKADIAREWGLRPSTLSTIMKNKEKILTQFKSQRYAVGRRRMRTAAYPDVEEALLTWFRYARAAGIPITGPVLQGMGVTLAQELGHPEFSCSVGWLDRFKARHGLSFNPKHSQDSGTSGTFNEPSDRVLSPIGSVPNGAVIEPDGPTHTLFTPAMPTVAPDITPVDNSSSSWFSNPVSGISNTAEGTEEQLDKWFPENMAVEEYSHRETTEDMANIWFSDTVPALLKDKDPRDIFSAGEAALFYNLLPDKSLAVKGEDGHRWTWVKERITFLVAVNMDGSEKLPLLVIGQKPSGQTNNAVDLTDASPLSYETNDSAMMTSAIFESWLRQLNQQYQASSRTIAIILENCPAHSCPKGLSNVQLVFLPADTMSRLQPVEHGVIHTLKTLYRRSMLESMVDALEAGYNYEVTFHEAMKVLQQSWEQIKTELIVECFKQAGLEAAQNLADSEGLGGEDGLALLERARSLGLDIPKEVTFESYLKIDSDVQTTVEQEGEAELSVEDEDVEDLTPPSEALQAVATLRKFIVEQGASGALLDTLADMENWVTKHIIKTEVSLTE